MMLTHDVSHINNVFLIRNVGINDFYLKVDTITF